MSDIPAGLKYTSSHEWVSDQGDGKVAVGITDHAQDALGDLVFVELPDTDTQVSAGDSFAVVESVKAASDVYAPVTGRVVEVNDNLADSPEHINEDPYGAGWIARVELADRSELDGLLDADAYQQVVEAEES